MKRSIAYGGHETTSRPKTAWIENSINDLGSLYLSSDVSLGLGSRVLGLGSCGLGLEVCVLGLGGYVLVNITVFK